MYLIEYFSNGNDVLSVETFVGSRAKLRVRVVELRKSGATIQSVASLNAGGLEVRRFVKG